MMVVAMILLNPGQDKYVTWIGDRLKEEKGILLSIGIDYVAKPIISTSTTKRDFILFSIYHTHIVSDKEIITLGICNQFIPIKSIAYED